MRHLLCVLLIAGCAGSGSATYHGSASVGYGSPDLVYVSPGVQVIADYDEPVFYTDGYYWRYYGNTWYRSHSYTGGWRYSPAPRALLRIERPHAYVRYRPQGYVSRRPVYRDNRPVYRDNRPVVRDHRPPYRAERPQHPANRPVPRATIDDLRDRDDRSERREERREDRRERRPEHDRDRDRDDKFRRLR